MAVSDWFITFILHDGAICRQHKNGDLGQNFPSLSSLNRHLPFKINALLYIVAQPSAFRCWSNRTSTAQTSSTVRGKSFESDLTTWEAITGSETNLSVSWRRRGHISWDSTCSHEPVAQTGMSPSTVRSLFKARRRTSDLSCLDTRATQETMHSPTTTEWCSPLMTATTTCRHPVTVQRHMAADSGTKHAPLSKWIPFAESLALTIFLGKV